MSLRLSDRHSTGTMVTDRVIRMTRSRKKVEERSSRSRTRSPATSTARVVGVTPSSNKTNKNNLPIEAVKRTTKNGNIVMPVGKQLQKQQKRMSIDDGNTTDITVVCEDTIRRSSRTRKTKSALELLGLKVKRERIDDKYESKQGEKTASETAESHLVGFTSSGDGLHSVISEGHVKDDPECRGDSSGVIDTPDDTEIRTDGTEIRTDGTEIGTDGRLNVIDGRLNMTEEGQMSEDVIIEYVDPSVVENFVLDLPDEEQPTKIISCENGIDSNQPGLNEPVRQALGVHVAPNNSCHDGASEKVEYVLWGASGSSKVVLSRKPTKINPTIYEKPISISGRMSRSGRILSCPKKFQEFTTMEQVQPRSAKYSDSEQNVAEEQLDLCTSLLRGAKRSRESTDRDDPGKIVKIITEKDGKVSVTDSHKLILRRRSDSNNSVVRVPEHYQTVEIETDVSNFSRTPEVNENVAVGVKGESVESVASYVTASSLSAVEIHDMQSDLQISMADKVTMVRSREVPSDAVPAEVIVKEESVETNTQEQCEPAIHENIIVVEPTDSSEAVVETQQYETIEIIDLDRTHLTSGEQSDGVVMVTAAADEPKAFPTEDDARLTYEALIKLASEVVNQVEGYDHDVVYQVQLEDGKMSHFMFKKPEKPEEQPKLRHNKPCHYRKSHKKSQREVKPVTSDELENLNVMLGKTLKGRSRPMKQLVVKKELQELVDTLKPTDSMDQHVTELSDDDEKVPLSSRPSRYKPRTKHFKCKYCLHLVADRHDFRKHIRTHPEVEYKPYACPLCDYKANIKAAVVRHINVHSEVMPYVCTICGRGFNFKQKLQTHMKYHKDIRDYQCPHCTLAFHEYKTLKNHIRCIHGSRMMIPSGEEAKGLKYRATALSRLAATRPSKDSDTVTIHRAVSSQDMMMELVNSSTGSDNGQDKENIMNPATEELQSDDSSCDQTSKLQDNNSYPAVNQDNKTIEAECNEDANNKDSKCEGEVTTRHKLSEDDAPRNTRTSKYTGTNKTKHITKRYRDGLTKFGASNDEIAASCPWRKQNKATRHLTDTQTQPATESVEQSVVVTEVLPAVESMEQSQIISFCFDPAVDGNYITVPGEQVVTSGGSDVVSAVALIQEPELDCVDEDAAAPLVNLEIVNQTETNESVQKVQDAAQGPVVVIHPLNPSQPPPHITEKHRPFVSMKHLGSSFDKVCRVKQSLDEKKQKWSTFHCRLCEKTVFSKTIMVQHIQTAHPDIKLWACPTCSYKCRLRSSIFVHMKIHEGDNKYKCDTCGKSYTLLSKLNDHLPTHSTEFAFKCEHCDKTFKRNNDLKKHFDRIHSQDRPFRCEVCDKTFKDKTQVKRHMDTHIDGRTLLCQVCNKFYKNKSSLQQHLKSHMCHFFCELCNKSFGSYSGFMAHKVMHTESFEGFHCDLCGKVLHTKGSLNRHLTISHSTARPFQCQDCKSAFKTKKDLKNHAIVHFSSKNYECSVCGFKSKRCESLAVHMRRHQDVKPFRCGICGREYTQKRSLQMHLPYHLSELQIRCQICNKRCVTKIHLQQHLKRVHCDVQGDFTGPSSAEDKKNATFYMCEECNSVFLTQDNLAVHILVQHMNQPHDLKVQLKSADPSVSNLDVGDKTLEAAEEAMDISSHDDMTTALVNIVSGDPSKDIVAQYVAITDPKSKQKRVVTVMHPITNDLTAAEMSQNVEVEGEVMMNINDTLVDKLVTAHDIKTDEFSSSDDVHHVLHNTSEAVVAMPTDTVSVTFTIPKDGDYSQDEPTVSFMDTNTNKFSVSGDTLVHMLTPETEVVSTDCMLSGDGAALVSIASGAIVSLSDNVILPNCDDCSGFVSVVETVETMETMETMETKEDF